MSKHTPAPWTIRELTGLTIPGQRAFAIDFNEDQEQVVDLVYEEADAHFISAAPGLLEVLSEAFDMIGSRLLKDTFGYEWHEKAAAAIARAKGEDQ
jgi:hypothetical protein